MNLWLYLDNFLLEKKTGQKIAYGKNMFRQFKDGTISACGKYIYQSREKWEDSIFDVLNKEGKFFVCA